MRTTVVLFLTIITFLAGCDMLEQDEYKQQYVIESYLVANDTLPAVQVSKTSSAFERYNPDNLQVNTAEVMIRKLTSSGDVQEVYPYTLDGNGRYVPTATHRVEPLGSYQLYVRDTANNNHEIRSITTVPGDFRNVGSVLDTVTYQASQQLEINITKSEYPGRQSIFIFNILARDTTLENLTPFYRDAVEGEDSDLSDFVKNSSNIVNQENYEAGPDSTLNLRFPWLGIAFYGRNVIVTNAMDDNVYDFIRTQNLQSGGSTLSPGELTSVIYHVDGGIGVFGSYATDTVETYVKPPTGF